MFINRLRFRDVKPLNRDIPEDGKDLPEPARKRLLLQGGNGSGKTTIFETIAALWQFWGEWIDVGRGSSPPKHQLKHFLATVGLAAMEIHSMSPGMPPLWVGMGRLADWDELKKSYPEHTFAGLYRGGRQWHIQLPTQGATYLQTVRNQTLLGTSQVAATPGQAIILSTGRPQTLLRTDPLANIVYFPPEGRNVTEPQKSRSELLDMIPFNWVARFDRKVNLDSVLLTVKTRDPERFEECLKFVNLALRHRVKRITGFGENGRLVVEGESDSGQFYQHAIEELSSGEKQMLLMIGFSIAFLRPGGILLIDEPDLHIHIAMIGQLLETLELIVREREGQLIVASHSPQVWDWFSRDEERIELTAWQVAAR